MSEENANYELGNEGFKFDLQTGNLHLDNANMTYHDAEGNEITRERFYELKVEKLERLVSQLAQELALKVDSNKVVNAINISPEGIRIVGDKIEINGETLIEDGALLRKDSSIKFDKEKILEALEEIVPTSLSGIQATLNKKA